ncbi:unnamed protein product [Rotaria magnacalcarata]|uniref:Hexosyltransferase n=1 Tax=Rotaria magnacalcarata TaxID=392030 RepID=A0A815RHS7_9BILA|nr:unnamed protein product [Rotaria magnacalcarata]CAF1477387.1 unnamed protein product [Rotaria magnacalcarata]CAF1937287.1 unnamed protein product [Rotaria magnacalcarata]CAF2098963.1 unnamed protein product [Rotaria magnacalcarata]CAF2243603.1 unnamed protein product [Rotaria magnacalcarata]
MWFIRKNLASHAYAIVFFILFSICLYITFYDKKFPTTSPISIPLITGRTNISPGPYLDVHLDLATNWAMCQKHDYLIIYVLSTITNVQRRQVIRSTWGSKQKDVCFVFIVGQVSGTTENAGEYQLKINNEKREHHDVVQIDHFESYANVIYKEIAALKWANHFYPDIPFLFKTDDDLIVDTILVSSIGKVLVTNVSLRDSFLVQNRPNLVSTIISSNRETFFRGGWAMDYQPTLRSGKFGVSEKVWPHAVLPHYCSGFGWFMSKNIREHLVNASLIYPIEKAAWIGDVFVSGFLANAANVKCTGLEIDFDQTNSANCSCLMVNNPMLTVCSSSFHSGGGGTEMERYLEYQKAWQVIQLRHNSSDRKIGAC